MRFTFIQSKYWQIVVHIFASIGLFLVSGFFAVKFGLTNTTGIIDKQNEFFYKNTSADKEDTSYRWSTTEEWSNFENAVARDAKVLKRVESETGVPARLIITPVFVEQMRLFNSNRQLFKELFSPLKILGTQTQFSLGVSGIKQNTAELIEKHLVDKNSPYYLGVEYEHYLDFKTTSIDNERFARITDYKDRYYSYLYTALYLKQLATAWQKAGHSLKDRPEILATLFNIGFAHSEPKPNPEIGGAEITIGEYTYSFGRLAGEFYHSSKLVDLFPRTDLIIK